MLRRENWERVIDQSEAAINQAQMALIINTHILELTKKELKKFPKPKKEDITKGLSDRTKPIVKALNKLKED